MAVDTREPSENQNGQLNESAAPAAVSGGI